MNKMKKLSKHFLLLSLFAFLILSMVTYSVNAQVKKNVKKNVVSEMKNESIVKSNVNQIQPLPFSAFPTVNCFPYNVTRSTGSVLSDGTISQTSLVKSTGDDGLGSGEQGWMKFDLSLIPSGSFIIQVDLHFYVNTTFSPWFYINQVTSDPETAPGSTLYSEITGFAGKYFNYNLTQATGWNVLSLNGAASADVQSLIGNWWAIGLYEYDGDPTYYFTADGWNETNKPYITVTYSSSAIFDAQTTALWMPTRIPLVSLSPSFAAQNIPWTAKVLNNGTQTAAFDDNARIYKNGVSDALTVTPLSLPVGGGATITGNYTPTSFANYNFSNTTLLSGDGTPANDSLYYKNTCVIDTSFAWDKGVGSSAVAWTNGTGYYGSIFKLSSASTLTSATVCIGSIPAAGTTANAIEVWSTSGGVPSALLATVTSGFSLTSAMSFTFRTYAADSPIALGAGTYFLCIHQTVSVASSYPLAYDNGPVGFPFTSVTVPRGISYMSTAGVSWSDLPGLGAYYGVFITRPNFAIPTPPNDVGTYSVDVTDVDPPGTTVSPKATIKNFGTASQTFDVNMTITGGYNNTQNITLAAGTSTQVTFANWTPAAGYPYVVNVCTQLAGDAIPPNDCMSKSVGVYTGAWTAGAVLPLANYIGGCVGYTEVVDKATTGYLFALGGGLTPGTNCYKYNVNTDTWTAIASLPAFRSRFATAINGQYIYVIGGYDAAAAQQSTVWKYDINNDAGGWVAVASLPGVLGWGRAVGHGNYVYLAGGVVGAAYQSAVLVYDISANTWSSATSMTDARFGGGFTCTGNTLVYIAGAAASGIINTVLKGEIDAGNPLLITWTLTTSPFPGNGNIYPKDDLSKTDLAGDITSKTVLMEGNKSNYPPGAMYRFEAAPWGTDGVIVAGGSPNSTWAPANPSPCFVYKPATNTWVKQGDLVSPATPTTGAFSGTVQYGTTWKLIVSGGVTTGGLNTTATSIWTDILSSPLNLGLTAMLSGHCDGTNMLFTKNITVELRQAATPYTVVESQAATLSLTGTCNPVFTVATNGTPYWIVIKSNNGLETWSATTQTFTGSTLSYDFTTAATQAYGSNMLLVGTKWCIFSGDVDQDGGVGALDRSACWNDRNLVGVYATDLDGDGAVGASDRAICWNNRNKAVIKPALVASPGRELKQDNKGDKNNSKGTYDLRLDGSNSTKKVTKTK